MPRRRQTPERIMPTLTVGARARLSTEIKWWEFWRRPFRTLLLLCLFGLGLFLGWLAFGGWASTTAQNLRVQFYQHTATLGLNVQQVYISGRSMLSADDITAALQLERGYPILAVDLTAAAATLQQLPWIASARVERHLPNVIYVELVERVPFARWQHENSVRVVDASGTELTRSNIEKFAHLPLLVGAGANTSGAALLAALNAVPEFAGQLQAAQRISDRRWDLRLNNGIIIKLPEEETAQALQKLAELWRTSDIAARQIKIIDARLPDRLVIDDGNAGAPDKPAAKQKP